MADADRPTIADQTGTAFLTESWADRTRVHLTFAEAQQVRDLLAGYSGFAGARSKTHPCPWWIEIQAGEAMRWSRVIGTRMVESCGAEEKSNAS